MLVDIHDPTAVTVVQQYLEAQRARGKRIGLTSGCFDLIHFQHFWYFIRCRRHCDELIVGVNSDEMVRKDKGPKRPFIFDFKRALMVDALKPVAFTFIMNGLDDLHRASALFRPQCILRNDEFAGREGEVVGQEFGAEVIIVYDVADHSSTTAIAAAIARELTK